MTNTTKTAPKVGRPRTETPAADTLRKREQYARDRAAGILPVSVRVPAARVEELRAFARRLMIEGAGV